jgi:hypothetical protein
MAYPFPILTYKVSRYDLIAPVLDGAATDPVEIASRYEVTTFADDGATIAPEFKPSR